MKNNEIPNLSLSSQENIESVSSEKQEKGKDVAGHCELSTLLKFFELDRKLFQSTRGNLVDKWQAGDSGYHEAADSDLVSLEKRIKRMENLPYSPFDPGNELKKIRQVEPGIDYHDENSDGTKLIGAELVEKIQTAKRNKFDSFKRNLFFQNFQSARIKLLIESQVREKEDMPLEEILDEIDKHAPKARLADYQLLGFYEGAMNYVSKHKAVKFYRDKYPDDNDFYKACFGLSPQADVKVITGPVSVYVMCYNLNDFARVYSEKYNTKKLTKKDIKEANGSKGVQIPKCLLNALSGVVIAENCSDNDREIFDNSTYVHEEQHVLHDMLYQKTKKVLDSKEAVREIETEKDLLSYLRAMREVFFDDAKDEILAYYRDGECVESEVLDLLMEEGGLYNFYDDFVKSNEFELQQFKDELVHKGLSMDKTNDCFKKVFVDEYNEVVKASVKIIFENFQEIEDWWEKGMEKFRLESAQTNLSDKRFELMDYNGEEKDAGGIIALFSATPLNRWQRLRDAYQNFNGFNDGFSKIVNDSYEVLDEQENETDAEYWTRWDEFGAKK